MRGVEKRQNGTNLHVQLKMADFLWTLRYDVKRLFCASGVDERHVPNFVRLLETKHHVTDINSFSRGHYRAIITQLQ